jgi:hypothetical protein
VLFRSHDAIEKATAANSIVGPDCFACNSGQKTTSQSTPIAVVE